MRTKYLFFMLTAILLVFTLFPLNSVGAQEPGTLILVPSSGPPGSVVTLYVAGNVTWEACYADSIPLGPVFGSITYTIPADSRNNIEFRCDNGPGSDEYSNVVYFTVMLLDTDGDGVFDQDDICPTEGGPAEWAGCPDTDGDGLPTQYDSCPTEFGPAENNGCPLPPTEVPVLIMPSSGPCVVATYGVTVNVRQGPSTSEPVVAALFAQQLYTVIGQTQAADGRWWQLDNGWVAGYVVQTGGDCSSVPQTGPPPPPTAPVDTDGDTLPDDQDACPLEAGPLANNGCPEPPVIQPAPSEVDLAPVLADCPHLLTDAQLLPVHMQLDLVYGTHQPNTCDFLQRQLGELVFGTAGPALSDPNTQAIMEGCPDVLPALVGMMDRLRNLNPAAWQLLDSVMTPDNACSLASAIAQGTIPPAFADVLQSTAAVWNGTDTGLVAYRWHPSLALPSDALIDTAIAICVPAYFGLSERLLKIMRDRIKQVGIPLDLLLASPCEIIRWAQVGGVLTSAQRVAMNRFITECGINSFSAFLLTSQLGFEGIDWAKLLAMPTNSFCTAKLRDFRWPKGTDPLVPGPLAACPSGAHRLFFRPDLTMLELWVILTAPDPCQLALKFILTGQLSPSDQTGPTPSCFDLDANSIRLADGRVLTGDSPWEYKIAILSRKANAVCKGMRLPRIDQDQDGNPDDTDQCPADFALTSDGCPASPIPPISFADAKLEYGRALIPVQSVMQGETIRVGIMDYAPNIKKEVKVTAAKAKNPIVDVSIAPGNMVVVKGLKLGTTSIEVTTDLGQGMQIISSFQTTVIPREANTAPVIDPIPDQEVSVDTTKTVLMSIQDADLDPLVVTVAAEKTNIGVIWANDMQLVITGVKEGQTAVTVIVSDGRTSSSTTFNLTVTTPQSSAAGGAGTQPPTTPEGNVPLSPIPFSPPSAAASADLSAEDEDRTAFALLSLPGEFVMPAISAFETHAGENQPGEINIVWRGRITPLLASPAESYLFPVLDPMGNLLAFLTIDAEGQATLRIRHLTRGISVPLVSDTATWRVGQYAPAWSPDGQHLLVTLVDTAGVPGIYDLNLSHPAQVPDPTLLIENAAAASFAPNGRYLAFEHHDPAGQTTIYVAVPGAPSAAHPIPNQPEGANCFTPMFGADSITLFFVCEVNGQRMLHRYGVEGLTVLDVGIPNVANPVPGPGVGFIGFDDGVVIYYGYDDGSRVVPLIRLPDRQASRLRWTTLVDLES